MAIRYLKALFVAWFGALLVFLASQVWQAVLGGYCISIVNSFGADGGLGAYNSCHVIGLGELLSNVFVLFLGIALLGWLIQKITSESVSPIALGLVFGLVFSLRSLDARLDAFFSYSADYPFGLGELVQTIVDFFTAAVPWLLIFIVGAYLFSRVYRGDHAVKAG